ncbi:MAG: TOBE domain-containing protein [Actinomycetota bacterium]|nr:TOBE domain-containing protein [Actinomycetota bacterium]
MPRPKEYPAGDAARLLGISLDTLRRWDAQGRIKTRRDHANKRVVSGSEIDRLLAARSSDLSARNRFRGVIREIVVEGLLAQVDIQVTEPTRVVAIITREAAEQLSLEPGMEVQAVVKATSVMVQK